MAKQKEEGKARIRDGKLEFIDERNFFEIFINRNLKEMFVVEMWFCTSKEDKRMLTNELRLTPMELRELAFRLVARVYWGKKTFTMKDAEAIWNADIPVAHNKDGKPIFVKYKEKLVEWLKTKKIQKN